MKNKIIELLKKPVLYDDQEQYKAMDINFIYIGFLEKKANDLVSKMSGCMFSDNNEFVKLSAQHLLIIEIWGELLKEFSIHKKNDAVNDAVNDGVIKPIGDFNIPNSDGTVSSAKEMINIWEYNKKNLEK